MKYFLTVWVLVHSHGHALLPTGGEYKDKHECEHTLEIVIKNVPSKPWHNLELLVGECNKIY